MTLEEVIKLIDAGYTKDDIQGMIQPAKPEPQAPQAPQPAKPAHPAQDDNPVLRELQELRKAVKAMTIVTGAAEQPAKTSVDDVLDKLIK